MLPYARHQGHLRRRRFAAICFWNPAFWDNNNFRLTLPQDLFLLVEKEREACRPLLPKGFGREAGVNVVSGSLH